MILIGISGSGKSTYASKLVAESRSYPYQTDWVSISRDSIRAELFNLKDEDHSGYYMDDLFRKEKQVTDEFFDRFQRAIAEERDIIIDNTTLELKYVKRFIRDAEVAGYEYIIKIFDRDLEECIVSDSQRKRQVGEDVIRKQAQKFSKLFQNKEFQKIYANAGI